MLLVIVIIGIVTAVTIPQFAKSMKGNRLRMAARTVVAAGRYARSMAVLHQRPMVVSFSIDKGLVTVAESSAKLAVEKNSDGEQGDASDVSALDELDSGQTREQLSSSSGASVKLQRKLDRVTIKSVETGGQESSDAGVVRVVYESNGRCLPYQVRLEDSVGAVIVIDVDALASASTARE
jgi:Tfp pilus assembly protein FimT